MAYSKEAEILQLTAELARASEMTSYYYPKGTSWHAMDPKFSEPPLQINDYDVSGQLYEMALKSREFIVDFEPTDEEYDGDDRLAPHHIWHISPPRGFGFVGSFLSTCNSDRNLPGIGFSLYCPSDATDISESNLRKLIDDGVINLDLAFFFHEGEELYNNTKPEGVLLNVVRRHPASSLKFALWMLESLRRVKNIHPEFTEFQITKT